MWTLSKKNHLFVWIFLIYKLVNSADVVIDIPQNGEEDENSSYRVFYTPPHGNPRPNVTFRAKGVHNVSLSDALPGTKYEFKLYYSNSTRLDWPIYTASITTAPDPPSNMSVTVINGTSANVTFQPPKRGSWDSFKLKMQLRNVENKPTREVLLKDNKPYVVTDLAPGGTYLFQLFTKYDKKESIITSDYMFTTRPNAPTKCIVWFRNETTLKFLWQPPLSPPVSIFSHYKVKIVPDDSPWSELIIENGEDPPGPAQAIFRDLVPGRPYNMSVQAVSDNEVASLPIFAQYRTTPLQPANLQVDPASVTTSSFTITWDPPEETTEFDKYLISLNVQQKSLILPLVRNKTEIRSITFNERLLPGRTYLVSAMTVSGKVNSAEATTNVTLRPLPIKHLKAVLEENGHVRLTWKPDNSSTQHSFEISYTEVYNNSILNGDTNILVSTKPEFILESLLPGRNYSIGVRAVSHRSQSHAVITFQATKPSAPVIEELKPIEFGLNISWKSDVNSRQEKYEILHIRNDSDSEPVRNVTKENHILLENLYPGAGYNIKVFSISHDLKSKPHDYFQAVYPKPPTNLRKDNVTSNSLSLTWDEPKDSLFSEFFIRSRTEDNPKWTKYSVSKTSVEIKPLMPGQHYMFQINSVSFGVDSASPITFNHTVYPSPVSSIATLIDSTNVTIEFPRPEGRIEYYIIKWMVIEKDKVMADGQKSKNISDGNSRAGTLVRILIDDLIPGVKYQFSMQTFSYNLTSSSTTFIALTVPLILSELVVVSSVEKPREMTIRYTPTPLNSSHFDKYQFNLSDVPYIQERDVNDPDRKVTFTDLVPGKLYNITVWTVSNNVYSQPLYRQDRLYPEPVTRVIPTDITDTHVTLVWDKPKGEYNSYEVQYLNSKGMLMQNLTTEENCTIDNLKPYKNYTFTITVRSGSVSNILRRSSSQSTVFQTKEGLPGMVHDFHPINVHPREVNFEWTLPENQWNGVLKRFIILYNQEGLSDVVITEFSPKDFNGSIKDLLPGKVYVFKIKAETQVGFGPESVWQGKMPILAPPKPSSQMVPSEVYRTSSTIQIRFRKNYFSDENGPIISYTLIVAEDDLKNTSGIEMPSWSDVQGYETWPPYQVLEPYYPFENTVAEDYTIGTENCENKESGYCNGPLKAGTTYRVKIRAFTEPSKFMDTEYSFPIQTDRRVLDILLYTLLPCVILISIGVGIYFLRKFHIIRKHTSGDENLNLSDCRMETSKPVRLDRFAAYYETMSADSDFRFSEEFEKLKLVGREQSYSAANLPCNRPKNRFTNILPYDHSRYKLQPSDDEEGSDYINANYVPGFNSPREFIVTQGPLPSTKDDFWRMCWESSSCAIVMLTKCFEKGREKCDHYWPEDTNRVFYGDISVTILNECVYSNWCVTEMVVQKGEVQRIIRHFHFTSWPDFGVPNPPTILVKFVNAFRNKIGNESRPIIVHCSAGVGRSGTFIAIDRILQSLEHKVDTVDIFGIVYQMRKERVLMVQTEQQYICIHQCLLAVLQGCESQPVFREDAHHNLGYEDDEGIAESGI